jgi:predicted regulator of amino acid metabolism with ACT domain
MERKYHAIIKLHNVGNRPDEIARTLKVNRKLICRTVQCFKTTGSTKNVMVEVTLSDKVKKV